MNKLANWCAECTFIPGITWKAKGVKERDTIKSHVSILFGVNLAIWSYQIDGECC